jgi:hypothetical protein
MSTDKQEMIPAKREAPVGFVTQARDRGMAPAMLAEQQRAKSEIEAALTIAAARPRDQKEAMDRILTSCQRPGLAAKAKYRYARGGTDIEGVTIDLMEVVAQMWGNLDFGFRELARFPGVGPGAGESVVEAFAWDLETNVKRKIQFTVQHAERTKKGTRVITDPRDIYEWVANQAQRRVRTCLENIIPRDIYETAAEECEKTMRANVGDVKEAVAKLLPAFANFGITKEMLEDRLQRRIETISAAQVVYLRTIWTGLRDGVASPEDWFDMTLGTTPDEKSKTAVEGAKEKMRQQQAAKPAQTAAAKPSSKAAVPPVAPPPPPQPKQDGVPEPEPEGEVPDESELAPEPEQKPEPVASAPIQLDDEATQLVEEYKFEAEASETLTGLRELRKHAENNALLKEKPDIMSLVLQMISAAEEKIRASRGAKANK